MIALAVAAALAAAPAPPTAQETAKTMDALELMYQQSCSVKAYGSYDDVCNGLRKQMKEAQKRYKKAMASDRAASRAAPAPQIEPATAAASTAPAAPVQSFAPAKN
jgi:hypothetical protein